MGQEDHWLSPRTEAVGGTVPASESATCPDCAAGPSPRRGPKVPAATLRSLLTEAAKVRLTDAEGFRFCPSPTCETVYWKPENGDRFTKADLRVRVGSKETTPPRPVCYCFGFSVEDVERQVRESGASSIPDEITDKVRRGLCHCEDANPKGTCCLGDVRALLKTTRSPLHAVVEASPSPDVGGQHACCAPQAAEPTPPSAAAFRAGILASVGAVVSAIFASACCWLPILLVAFGASSASLAGFLERYRVVFLGGAACLLGLGFYLLYSRKSQCGPNGACSVPSVRVQRFNRVALGIAAVLVIVAGALPKYVSVYLGATVAPSGELGERRAFSLEGMTCEACAVTIRSELERLPGVASASVSYERKEVTITLNKGEGAAADSAVIATIERAGYRAARKDR